MLTLEFQGSTGSLPTSQFVLRKNRTEVGFIQIRHVASQADDLPTELANHIYYEVLPGYRGKGYGREMLRLGLIEAWKRGLKEVVITCLETNTASKRVIEANGGELVARVPLRNSRGAYLKYLVRQP